jgi:hypothetical protein
MKRLFLLCLCVLFPLGLFTVEAQDSLPPRWSSPLLLGNGWWQSMTFDQEGNLHVGWYGSNTSNDGSAIDQMIYTMRRMDGDWTPQVDAVYTGLGGFTVRNALAATSDGLLHAVFRANTAHQVASSAIVGATDAANWSVWQQVSDTGYYTDMIADRNDVLHLVFSGNAFLPGLATEVSHRESSDCFRCYNLFYRRSADGGQSWSSLTPVSIEPNSGSDKVSIQEGLSGRLYITWDEGADWYSGGGRPLDVRMVYSDDGGLSWSAPIILDGGNLKDRRPIEGAFTELRDGALMAVWRYSTDADRSLYYQLSNDVGQTWTQPLAIPGILARSVNESSLDHYALLTDRLGQAHLFVVGQTSVDSTSNAQLYTLVYTPGSRFWRAPQLIFYSPEQVPDWPEAVVGLSNDIHLTWFTGFHKSVQGPQDNTADLRVYYSYLPGNLAAEPTVAFRPTQTPLPTPTVFQNIQPSSTPFPTLADINEALNVDSRDNYAAQTVLGGLLIAALFCAGVLVLVRLTRR